MPLLAGFRRFEPGSGDLERARKALAAEDGPGAVAAIELMRVRWAAQHDGLVAWIQEVQTEIAGSFGEDAIRESVTLAYEHIWKPRYELWGTMTPELRLQLSVEGMRGGHLSGPAASRRCRRQRRGRSLRHVARPLWQLRRAAERRPRQRPSPPPVGDQPGAACRGRKGAPA